ncbi:MAG: hypothetical protein ACD_32C00113G0006 [uncultured bacterium]|uniref:DUF5672 domain-containing protein n=1 Tax=Candidatus Daviesbacteria bacterium GW2011_GWC2_40_12 TaxID=1618431 RepID=A0A0G0QQF0_9BACT|nr:MAG: hypothetical protein ACD_32C00113G0006 [uncultured bacterium]KKQ82582.1 MAG: hypothetical protein UT04_C0056G0005 [Candidatus Daviesbacteria bacterium GW2011_GWF2_38_7]KKR17245.1 MAG: hypothetical protein UT45_C0002G0074 [Candidatus Daviesbacteria bacterium GW2011_GWA2_39_33]KKR42644.1 MAG: hypothetical protein UT77_C0001G0095 [Candidatus Daviesbacteria bacterium GW2011_GWC2_40_12]OGE21319.1 MAG: hypothetical protein A2778_04085 [Candidatus Daviesbacteria bacterium RIFCSPHIGHO2_01_FULL_
MTKINNRLVIVIPTHRPNLTAEDKISLSHLKKHLPQYDTFFVIPESISSKAFTSCGYKVVKVNRNFFGTLRKANEMYLSVEFYEIFRNYDYMLIYQLDALIFSNQLEKWTKSGYDFIAAPWFNSVIGYLSYKKGYPSSGGNGGFSLRNIQKFLKILRIVNKTATRKSKNPFTRKLWFLMALLSGKSHKMWLNAPADNYPFNEDGFWSLEAPKYDSTFKVPPFQIAIQFAFERFPHKCFIINKGKLPFGCHAWKKYDEEFWKPYILK